MDWPHDTAPTPDRSCRRASGAKPDGHIAPASIRVWDIGVRIFHWTLLAAVTVAAATGFLAPRNWLNLHIAAGVGIATLVIFRLVWGFTGTTYARFASFAVSPRQVMERVIELRQGRARRFLGHNPLGAVMVLMLLAVLCCLVISGAVALGGTDKQGPFAVATSFAVGEASRRLHAALALVLVGLVAAHIAGVLFESLTSRENLVWALVSGWKAGAPPAVVARRRRALPRHAAIVLSALVVVGVPIIIAYSSLPGLGVPDDTLDASYVGECGACHIAYHPSLSPAATWSALLDGLKNHFGEDASLDPETTARLRDYLTSISAEYWDTRAANLFRIRDGAEPLRLTATPAWMRLHRHVAPALFASKAVGRAGACAACHQDAASGRFDPQAISLPSEMKP